MENKKKKENIKEKFDNRLIQVMEELSELPESKLRSFALNVGDANIVKKVLQFKRRKEATKKVSNLLEQLRDLKKELTTTNKILKELSRNSEVKSYKENMKRLAALEYQIKKLNDDIEKEKLFGCEHIWYVIQNDPIYGTDSHNIEHACMKCGIDSRRMEFATLSNAEQMFFKDFYNQYNRGIRTDIFCNNYQLEPIYQDILKNNPCMTDEEIVNEVKLIMQINKDKKKQLSI